MTDVSPEIVERMVALVRDMARHDKHILPGWAVEARDLAALLPKPVDPDLIEARNLLASFYRSEDLMGEERVAEVEAGRRDDKADVRGFLLALKRGRELAGRHP